MDFHIYDCGPRYTFFVAISALLTKLNSPTRKNGWKKLLKMFLVFNCAYMFVSGFFIWSKKVKILVPYWRTHVLYSSNIFLEILFVFGYMHSVVHCTYKCREANTIQKAHSKLFSNFSPIIVPCKLAHRQCNVIFKKNKAWPIRAQISQTKEGTLLFFVYTQEVGIMVASTYNNHL